MTDEPQDYLVVFRVKWQRGEIVQNAPSETEAWNVVKDGLSARDLRELTDLRIIAVNSIPAWPKA